MSPLLRNVLAILAGIVIGSIVNMGIIMLGPSIIPLPEGVDPTSVDSIKANIDKFEAKNFILPFLAHALGTLVGAFLASKVAANNKYLFAMVIGAWFLVGGILNSMAIPGPAWFTALDLLFAYLPMAYLGHRLAR